MRVPDNFLKCVGFVGYRPDKGDVKLAGTAFFVSLALPGVAERIWYTVTAAHVAEAASRLDRNGSILLRVNTRHGAEVIETRVNGTWVFHDETDVAVCSTSPVEATGSEFDHLSLDLDPDANLAGTRDFLDEQGIGVGDECYITGLFARHYGNQRNQPIIRVGNIAMLPDDPVRTTQYGDVDAYLVEAKSIGGLSGSPVFAHTPPVYFDDDEHAKVRKQLSFLLGLVHGHWSMEGDNVAAAEDSNGRQKLNMGIAVVIPVEAILDILLSDGFANHREQLADQIKDSNATSRRRRR